MRPPKRLEAPACRAGSSPHNDAVDVPRCGRCSRFFGDLVSLSATNCRQNRGWTSSCRRLTIRGGSRCASGSPSTRTPSGDELARGRLRGAAVAAALGARRRSDPSGADRRRAGSAPVCDGRSTRSGSAGPVRRSSTPGRRSRRIGTCGRSSRARSSGASCSRSPAAGATSPTSGRGPCATATSSSSTVRRSGPAGRSTPSSASCSPAPIRSCPSTRASRTSSARWTRPGIEIRPITEMTGGHTFNEVFFTDVRIPAANLVGDLNDGWRLAKVTLGNERISLSSGGVLWGNGPTALDLVEAVKRRGPLTDPTLRQRVAQIYVEHTVLELIRMRTLSARLKGEQPGPEASIRKLLGDEHGQHVMALARDLIGAAALLAGDRSARHRVEGPRARSAAGRPRSPGLVRRVPVLAGVDDRRRHRRGAAQHRRRAGPRPAPRRRCAAGVELGRGRQRAAWLISSPPPRRSPRWSLPVRTRPSRPAGCRRRRSMPSSPPTSCGWGLPPPTTVPRPIPLTMLTAIEILSSADGAAGWCSMIASTTSTQSLFLQPSAAREVYGEPTTVTGGAFAPDGSRRRRGRQRDRHGAVAVGERHPALPVDPRWHHVRRRHVPAVLVPGRGGDVPRHVVQRRPARHGVRSTSRSTASWCRRTGPTSR